jgi:predicted nucleotidyltransferase component of viral defense system
MIKVLEDMLQPYAPKTPLDWLQATRELVQEIILLGFWRGGFFEHAAFYGGTTLRIFSLDAPHDSIRLEHMLSYLELELSAWGFSFESEPQLKQGKRAIESAFVKGNTRINLLNIEAPDEISQNFPANQKISVKLELDTNPPPFAKTEVKTHLMPTPYQVRLYDLPSLFAGKLHAILFRDSKNRVKGRDFYDLIWFVARRTPVNLPHLEARIRQSGDPTINNLDLTSLHNLLHDRFSLIDFAAAANEVRPFLRDARELDLWTRRFFQQLVPQICARP